MSLTEREKKITNKATLEVIDELDYPEGGFVTAAVAQKIVDKALSRIREEQEAVAYGVYQDGSLMSAFGSSESAHAFAMSMETIVPLFTTPPAAPEARCPTCDGAGDVHSPDGEYHGRCSCVQDKCDCSERERAYDSGVNDGFAMGKDCCSELVEALKLAHGHMQLHLGHYNDVRHNVYLAVTKALANHAKRMKGE